MNVQEIMTRPAVTCRPGDTLNTAAQIMWEQDCGAVPVVDDGGKLVGLVTDRDICMAALTRGSALSAIPVAHAMAKQVYACEVGDSVGAAELLMSDKQIRRVPVVDGDNRPVGLLSLADIARHATATGQKNGLEREVTRTLASICRPRPAEQTPRKARGQAQAPPAM